MLTSIALWVNVEELKKKNDILKEEIKILEAETLKYQLQPHTLLNLFAHMQALSKKISKGWDSLSNSLEYIFYNGENHFVTIKEELHFVENYLTLNKVFLQHIDAVEFIDNSTEEARNSESKVIPHLITAYLLENAFKHGDKTAPEFLMVKVIANEEVFEIIVENKFRHSRIKKTREGIGIKNMRKRLDLFVPEKYEIKSSCNEHLYSSSLKIML